MIKSLSGIVAAVAFLCCCSQAEAGEDAGGTVKLMGDRPGAQGPEWVLYEDMPEEGEIVSFNQAGDGDGAFEICQSEDGAVGSVAEGQGGTVCDTKDGAKDSFYVLRIPDQDDQGGVDEDEGETGGLARKLQKKGQDHRSGEGVAAGFISHDFHLTMDERMEIQEALEATEAWQRFLEEGAQMGAGRQGVFYRTGNESRGSYLESVAMNAVRRCTRDPNFDGDCYDLDLELSRWGGHDDESREFGKAVEVETWRKHAFESAGYRGHVPRSQHKPSSGGSGGGAQGGTVK